MGGARRGTRGREEPPGLVPRRRRLPQSRPLLHPLLPCQLRWYGPDAPDRRRRYARNRVLPGPSLPDRLLFARGSAAGERVATGPRWEMGLRTGAGRYERPARRRLENAGAVRRQRTRWDDRRLRRDLSAHEPRPEEEISRR